MNSTYCPYCHMEIDIDDPDGIYYNSSEQYECSNCGKIFIVYGEPIVEYLAYTVEEHYTNRIECLKKGIDYYEKQMEDGLLDAEWCRNTIEQHFRKDLIHTQEQLSNAIEYNKGIKATK